MNTGDGFLRSESDGGGERQGFVELVFSGGFFDPEIQLGHIFHNGGDGLLKEGRLSSE